MGSSQGSAFQAAIEITQTLSSSHQAMAEITQPLSSGHQVVTEITQPLTNCHQPYKRVDAEGPCLQSYIVTLTEFASEGKFSDPYSCLARDA